jgi:ATP-dependent Lon protease
VKQKVLAAHRAGLTEVVLPVRNGPDLEDVPETVRELMTFHLASTVSDVLAAAVEGGGAALDSVEEGLRGSVSVEAAA